MGILQAQKTPCKRPIDRGDHALGPYLDEGPLAGGTLHNATYRLSGFPTGMRHDAPPGGRRHGHRVADQELTNLRGSR